MVIGAVRRKRGRKRGSTRKIEDTWYRPTIRDAYAQLTVAKTMLDRIPNEKLAIVKREMGILEDMMWRFM